MNRMLYALIFLLSFTLNATEKPKLLLAEIYDENIDVSQYWVSEKLDGVRAFWDGKQLISRGGHVLAAPAWFTEHFPANKLDGELWLARGEFAETLSTVSKQQPVDSQWQKMTFYVFELPNAKGTFTQRIKNLTAIITKQQSAYLKVVPQFRFSNTSQLLAKLQQITEQGGEGLMLHHQDALYHTGRSDALLKLKTYQDAEAEVVGYRKGKGKYQNMVGALELRTDSGQEFAVGSGLTDALRQNPPAIGSIITFRFNGLTANGLPRFARFLRVRENL